MKKMFVFFTLAVITISFSGCFTPTGMNAHEQRQYAGDMADQTLKLLYKHHPEAKDVVEKSSGYVIYNTCAIDYFFLATENGWGIAVNNKSGDKTVLKDVTLGVGPGLGVANMRDILVFEDELDFKNFVAGAWGMNLKASAVACLSGDANVSAAGAINLFNNAKAYKVGKQGLILEAVLDLQRSWINHSLEK